MSLEHHERLDGSGYPNALRGSDIHLFSRIVAVCDVYDALATERSYKKAYRPDQAALVLRETTNLDKRFVEALLKHVVLYPIGTKVRLSNGAIGSVVRAQSSSNPQPMVKLLFSRYNESFLQKRKLEVLEVGNGVYIEGAMNDNEYQQLLQDIALS